MRRVSPSPDSYSLPSLGQLWAKVALRDRAPVILAAFAVASLGSLAFVAATSAPVATRLEVTQHMVSQSLLSATGQMGLRLQDVNVAGRNKTRPDDIWNALGIRIGEPLLSLDLVEAQERLEGLAWVKEAVVERVFPNALRINLVERTPVALWQSPGGQFQLVDADGILIDEAVAPFLSLPVVVGHGAPEAASDLLAMLNAQPEIAYRVKAAVRYGQRRWDLWIDGYGPGSLAQDDAEAETSDKDGQVHPDRFVGVQVRLPELEPELALARLARLEREEAILERKIAIIDLRQEDRLIVRQTFDTPSAPVTNGNEMQNPSSPHAPWEGIPFGGPARDA